MTRCEYDEQDIYGYFERTLDFIQRERLKKHISECSACKKKMLKILEDRIFNHERVFEPSLIPEYQNCLSTSTLEDYVNGGLTEEEKRKVENHLEECDYCYSQVLGYKMVLEKEKKYKESTVKKEVADLRKRIVELVKDLVTSISDVSDIFAVELIPQPVYRGVKKEVLELPEIVCSGGDVVFSLSGKTEVKNIEVELIDIDEKHSVQIEKSDELGRVWFKNLPPGTYYVKVKYHKAKIMKL